MKSLKSGDIVVVTHRAINRYIGKVGIVHAKHGIMTEVLFLQPTANGERTGMFFSDELVLLIDTALDTLPLDLVP